MKKFFKKSPIRKPYYLRNCEYSPPRSCTSTPKRKADACVSCDLPFDESDIAPELRRNNSSVDAPVEDSPSANRTNLEEVDISIDVSASEIGRAHV